MTTIVGYVEPGVGVWIGGDTRVVSSEAIVLTQPKKLIHVGRFIVGHAGDLHLGNLLAEMTKLRPRDIGDLCKRLREAVVSAEFTKKGGDEEQGAPDYGQQMLVAERHRLWDVSGSFSYSEVLSRRLASVGSGSWHAMGAGYVMKRSPGRTIITRSLDAAAAFDTLTARPFHIECIDW